MKKPVKIPAVVIAAPKSGSGKSVISCALMQTLMLRGKTIAAFKCGPDHIDPLLHEKIIGRPAGNLDLFFADKELLRSLYAKNSRDADIAVIEGVMGYYDGMGAGSMKGSTYDIAKTLGLPVLLIIDAGGQSVSALASLYGFLKLKEDSNIRGVIFNRMSEAVYKAIKPEVEKMGVYPLGYVPKREEFALESRYLGLILPDKDEFQKRLIKAAKLLEETLDIDALFKLADSAQTLQAEELIFPQMQKRAKIAVAKDEAFTFFYKDDLALLRELGADIAEFSPIRDEKLPEGTQGLWLGGGYPELFAEKLSQNISMLNDIKAALERGLPCIATGGGFLYLHEELENENGEFFPRVGSISGRAYKRKSPGNFGYTELISKEDTEYFLKDESIKAHEFHYYASTDAGSDFDAVKPIGDKSWEAMHSKGKLLAGFAQMFLCSEIKVAKRFIKSCAEINLKEDKLWRVP
ncbi:MAG: cobyrinate a,c-diamide synthase [Firmicutes bacterium]|nr:cobyrinate a,c-diamide synthase [Bacillota bacterium]